MKKRLYTRYRYAIVIVCTHDCRTVPCNLGSRKDVHEQESVVSQSHPEGDCYNRQRRPIHIKSWKKKLNVLGNIVESHKNEAYSNGVKCKYDSPMQKHVEEKC